MNILASILVTFVRYSSRKKDRLGLGEVLGENVRLSQLSGYLLHRIDNC